MSLEESMKDLAESNRELAAAQRYYAGVIEKFGLKVESENEGKAPAAAAAAKESKPAAGKGKSKPADPPAAAKEDDGFGDDEGGEDEIPKELNADIIKAKLFEVKDAYGDKAVALKIIQDLGYNAIPDVKAKDYEKVYKLCVASLKNAP